MRIHDNVNTTNSNRGSRKKNGEQGGRGKGRGPGIMNTDDEMAKRDRQREGGTRRVEPSSSTSHG